jgi:hypothetical protein
MNAQVHVAMKPAATPARDQTPTQMPAPFGTLQRKCACGGASGSSGECESCKKKKTLQRRAAGSAGPAVAPPIVHDVLRSPGRPLDTAARAFFEPRFGHDFSRVRTDSTVARLPAGNLAVNQIGDRFEREADRTAERVMNKPAPAQPAAGHSFANVRIHTDDRAAQSARSVGALAYTVGQDIVFASGQYSPHTTQGRRLLAHELTHTLQQSGSVGRMVMGKWEDSPDCKDAPKDKWIDKITVNQETPQTVNVHWSNGDTESDQCSSGKGHCCVDPANPTGVTCTAAGSRVDGSNCTPIGQLPVQNRVANHSGIHYWTEIEPNRAIALHQYDDYGVVDGTPLSHGCVRLHLDMAKKIFCGVHQNKTMVEVQGFARPKCDWPALQQVWQGDFDEGGRDLSKADGDEKANIVETRKELNAAFGRTLTVDEMQKLTAKDIPRCGKTAPLPQPAAPTGTGNAGSGSTGTGSN